MHPLHEKALGLASEFKRVEADLIDVLQRIDQGKVFRKLGYSSLYDYVVQALKLSESVAYALITVCRKAVEIPALKLAIQAGEISVSKAKNIVSVLTPENAPDLLEKAKVLTTRQLEKEIARIHPEKVPAARVRYLTDKMMELKLALSEEDMKILKRIQDLESQRTRKASSLEEALRAAMNLYLERKDPLKKELSARRVLGSAAFKRNIPAAKKLSVQQRDECRCTYVDSGGQRCRNTRWLEIHHLIPLSLGGPHDLENLTTLCHSHHQSAHE